MTDFIVKYWLEFIFGILCTGLTFIIKHHYGLMKKDRERHEKDMINALTQKLDEQKSEFQCQMGECHNNLIDVIKEYDEKSYQEDQKIHEEIYIIKDGMLSVQGRDFKKDCRKLLKEDHIITVNEYEDLLIEHATYNRLGGNHEGDGLFSMVTAKYQNQLALVEHK